MCRINCPCLFSQCDVFASEVGSITPSIVTIDMSLVLTALSSERIVILVALIYQIVDSKLLLDGRQSVSTRTGEMKTLISCSR